ncbi:MAG: PilN domain-containing protein [Patescibacteria group bacterium]
MNDETRAVAVKEYSRRRMVIVLFLFCTIVLVGILELFPSYMLSFSRKNIAAARIEQLKRSPSSEDGRVLEKWLSLTNKKLVVLSPDMGSDLPYEIFQKIIKVKPAGISLFSLRWTKSAEGATITLSGTARDRQTLLAFQDSLNASKAFSKAVLPISSFAKDKDLQFEVSVSPVIKK